MVGIFGALLRFLNKNKKMLYVDVSHHNGLINWKKVALNNPKVDGAILKASEGASGRDKKFTYNAHSCILSGIKWGAYHFATWNLRDIEKDAKQEAHWFLSTVKMVNKKPDLPLVLDIESNIPIPYTKAEMVKYVKTFTDIIKNAGYEVAIYASPGFLNLYFPKNHPFTDIKLWVADYTGSINSVPGWKNFWLHQYTETGTISGIPTPGHTDLNKTV